MCDHQPCLSRARPGARHVPGQLVHPARALGLSVVAMDHSATVLRSVPEPRVRGDARRLPFRGASFGAVAALYMLYHLRDPREAIAESCRVLRAEPEMVRAYFTEVEVERGDAPLVLLPDRAALIWGRKA